MEDIKSKALEALASNFFLYNQPWWAYEYYCIRTRLLSIHIAFVVLLKRMSLDLIDSIPAYILLCVF